MVPQEAKTELPHDTHALELGIYIQEYKRSHIYVYCSAIHNSQVEALP